MTTASVSEVAVPLGGSTPMEVIAQVRNLIMTAGVALRAIPRIFEIFTSLLDPAAIIPSASGARWWLQRLGLFTLQEPLDIADDWVFLIDHSVQIGSVKVCVILGLRLSELPSPARPLRHQDMRLLALVPTEHSNGEIVDAQLEQAALRTSIPRQIVSDHGSDVKKGSELFAARHAHTQVVYDAAHYGAIVLKRQFEADDRWADLIAQLGQTKARIQQSSDAYLMSPSLRPKARYMNIASLLRWSRRILSLLNHETATSASRRATARYGWLEKFRGAISEWSRWESTVSCSVAFVRTHGLSHNCDAKLAAALKARPSQQRHGKLEAEFIEFANQQSEGIQPGERLVGSTEILESAFGKWKTLERQQSSSGITSLILSLGAMFGNWTCERLQEALEMIPVKKVKAWSKANLLPSVQSQRRLAFSEQST